jgi:hypothetical protein
VTSSREQADRDQTPGYDLACLCPVLHEPGDMCWRSRQPSTRHFGSRNTRGSRNHPSSSVFWGDEFSRTEPAMTTCGPHLGGGARVRAACFGVWGEAKVYVDGGRSGLGSVFSLRMGLRLWRLAPMQGRETASGLYDFMGHDSPRLLEWVEMPVFLTTAVETVQKGVKS